MHIIIRTVNEIRHKSTLSPIIDSAAMAEVICALHPHAAALVTP